ncbi:adenosylmethionine decarboxylase [Tenacibaculum tangerinum]|uniref:S-adenosylmethionine decarboxylase proenzyme n=1 Tax=Tenacibaculum tangerinum TaxID=3038772 RepID=A0ABY8L245_9FLAO|nr:adenosylmethionine decarboxylase [Tenacibaculum tangerinum]WGH75517.1 adenosylmethionine decarboxylase [Tenacibaculum tangerinum]
MKRLGYHGLWEINDSPSELLKFEKTIKPFMDAVADTANLTVLSRNFKQFSPYGVTGVFLLSESHLSIHTWPEHGYAALDLFSCKKFNASLIKELIKEHFETETIVFTSIERGLIDRLELKSQ